MNESLSIPSVLKHLTALALPALLLCATGCRTTPPVGGAGDTKADEATTQTIIGMEKAALERWCKGDPSGFLEIYAPDVVYFDSFVEKRQDGREAMVGLYEKVRGKINVDRFELVNPKVQLCGDMAVLTFNFVSEAGGKTHRWNATDVYRRTDGQWRIIHANWSLTGPPKK